MVCPFVFVLVDFDAFQELLSLVLAAELAPRRVGAQLRFDFGHPVHAEETADFCLAALDLGEVEPVCYPLQLHPDLLLVLPGLDLLEFFLQPDAHHFWKN
jgi:hypothetical protein